MKRQGFNLSDLEYALPPWLIAAYPCAQRTESALLSVQGFRLNHLKFANIDRCLQSGDALVLNRTRVVAARLKAKRESGATIEILLERPVSSSGFWARVQKKRKLRAHERLWLNHEVYLTIQSVEADFVLLHSEHYCCERLFELYGHTPLPPYIKRPAEPEDAARYQTVYARHSGSVAAPTAGLHFDQALLQRLQQRGIETIDTLLHVASGTYQPLQAQQWQGGTLHKEYMELDQVACEQIERTRQRGGRLVAVGTTSLRVLESIGPKLKPFSGYTDLLIKPGFEFHWIDALITNFHLPGSSPLALLHALVGTSVLNNAYTQAIAHRYRFGSYGDSGFWQRS